jgi:hypothetical protein
MPDAAVKTIVTDIVPETVHAPIGSPADYDPLRFSSRPKDRGTFQRYARQGMTGDDARSEVSGRPVRRYICRPCVAVFRSNEGGPASHLMALGSAVSQPVGIQLHRDGIRV